MKISTYFPTHIFSEKLNDDGLLADLRAACFDCAENDGAGQDWSEENGYAGYTSYASLDDLDRRYPAIEALCTQFDMLATQAAAALQWDLTGKTLSRAGVWVNILGEGGGHSGHIHPGNVLSGTAYIDLPEGAGNIRFEDPRLGLKMAAPPLIDTPDESARRFVYIAPNSGDILLWESWLRHEVMPNTGEDLRLSISFNYALG